MTEAGDIRLAAMNLLARREHSLQELRRKLRRRFENHSLVEEQLQRLADESLQNDMRFTESFLHQRIRRGVGPLRLVSELRERGITEDDSRLAMDAMAEDWSALAESVLKKKFGEDPPVDIRDKARRARFLQYRGFSSEHFRHLLD